MIRAWSLWVHMSDTLRTQLRDSSGLAKVRSIINSRPDLLKVGLLPSLSRHTFNEATASRRMVPSCVVLALPHVVDYALKSPAMRIGDHRVCRQRSPALLF